MTLGEMIETYGGNVCISIDGYCEEKSYDYYAMPLDYRSETDEEVLSDNNPNHYKPTCLAKEPWWDKVKDREVIHWNIIGGGMNKVELTITLEEGCMKHLVDGVRECTEKGGCKKKMRKDVVEPVEEKLLNPLGEYAAKFAENHGMSISEAMEQPVVKAYSRALSAGMKPLV